MPNIKRILVLDGEQTMRRSFEVALENIDCEVAAVETGKEGIEKLKNKKYQLVFLDFKIPDMSSAEILHDIHKLYPALPVYIIADFHKEHLAELDVARTKGLQFHLLRKPIGYAEIQVIAQSVIARVRD